MEWFLYLVTGLIAGFLAGLLGISGGIIIVPFLSVVFVLIDKFSVDTATHLALGTSVAIVFINTLISLYGHLRVTSVDWSTVRRFLPGLLFGGILGPIVAGLLSGVVLSVLVGFFIFIIALRILFVKVDECTLEAPPRKNMFVASLGIGTLSSLVGSGGSTFSIPFLSHIGLPMRQAIGVAVFCTLPFVAVASAGFMLIGLNEPVPAGATGYIYWPAFLTVLAGSLLCTLVGIKVGCCVQTNILRKILAIILLIVSFKMLFMCCW